MTWRVTVPEDMHVYVCVCILLSYYSTCYNIPVDDLGFFFFCSLMSALKHS